MQSTLIHQGLIFLMFVTSASCLKPDGDLKVMTKMDIKFGHNVIQRGHIISRQSMQPKPIDQIRVSEYKPNNSSQDKPKTYVIHGDILLRNETIKSNASRRFKRKIISETNYFGDSNRWPGGIIPYEFISGIDYQIQQNVLSAIKHWHEQTCIRFEPFNPSRHWYIGAKVMIEDTGSGCATYVGYRPASNGYLAIHSLYLPADCPLGSMIHELGHVVGFYHEMSRADRDEEIRIQINKMSTGEATQYEKIPDPIHRYYGQPYDLGSIMHYYPTENLVAIDKRRVFLMGQRVTLSYLDAKLANIGYRCGYNCNPKPICENEGYVNQHCKCTCPKGFYGDQCNLLQGYLVTSWLYVDNNQQLRSMFDEKARSLSTASTQAPTTKLQINAEIQWLPWSDWSNCSKECGIGVRFRSRLCSKLTNDGGSDLCSSLPGSSLEIAPCHNPECKESDTIMSCTFDLHNESCPIQIHSRWRIQEGLLTSHVQPISDHTRGDGKYLIFAGTTNRFDYAQKFQLDPVIPPKLSNSKNHCLRFWYFTYGKGVIRVTIINNQLNKHQNDFTFVLNRKDQGKNWKLIQQTISNVNNYKLIFKYESITSDPNTVAIDDITITNGPCEHVQLNNQHRRERRQINSAKGCSRIIDLTVTNQYAPVTSPNYPSLYPINVECYYYIRAPQAYRVLLQFTDFNIPTYNQNACDDSLEIRYYHLGQPGPTYCGTGANSNNLQFTSSKNYILIVFRSNQNTVGRGFRAQASLVQ